MATTTDNLVQSDAELFEEIDKLADAHRVECLWFVRRDYLPTTTAARLQILRYLEMYGDRATFVKARTLRDCLLQISSETSAGS